MTFNALILGMIFPHFGTFLLFYNNTPWLFKDIPFNYTSVHLRRGLTGEKVGRWGDIKKTAWLFCSGRF